MKIKFCVFVMLACSLNGYGQSAKEYVNKGNERASVKDYTGAISEYSNAIIKTPDYAEAYCKRGRSNIEIKQYGKAILDFNKAIELKPDYAEAYTFRGVSRIGMQRTYSIDEIYDYDKQLAAGLSLATSLRVNLNTLGGEEKFIELDQKDTTGRLTREYVYNIKISPRDAIGYFSRGILKSHYNDCDGGIADIVQSIKIEPKYKDSIIICPGYFQAIEDFTIAIQINPQYPEAYYWRGFAYIKSGIEEACDDLAKAEKSGDKRASDLIKQYCN